MEYNYAEVYLEPEFYPKKYSKYVGKNIRNIGFDKLEEIIKHIVLMKNAQKSPYFNAGMDRAYRL